MKRFEHRLRQLEAHASGGHKTIACEIWIVTSDGLLHGNQGEVMSPEAFDRRQSRARTAVILPHNGRDPLRSELRPPLRRR